MAYDEYNENTYNAWKEFINTGNCNKQVIRSEIAESWIRCRRAKVDPYGGVCNNVLIGDELEDLLRKNEELIKISEPFLFKLYEFFKDSGYYVILTDSEGYILDLFGDRFMDKEALDMNFKKGACWKEEYVGSTTIGIMIYHKKPLQMTGGEHYCIRSHGLTCSAAPILNETGELIGILNVTGPCNDVHKHSLGMVVAAVDAIKHLLTIRQKNRELQLINERMTNIFNTVSEGIIIFDKNKEIEMMNPVAEKIIGKDYVQGKSINEIIGGNNYEKNRFLHDSKFNDVELALQTSSGKVECLVSGVHTQDKDQSNGIVTVIRPMDKIQKLVKMYGNQGALMDFSDIIGESTKIEEAMRIALRASAIEGTVLLQGESGTGKEVFAQAIHNRSQRRKGPFVALNCGAIPRELVGSELFGYIEGAFTGAARGGRPGKFELASHGTIFLDEIGDMPLEQQVSLLRVLQERKVIRIGDNKEIPVDVRVICASNKPLFKEVERGNFRQDLFYRLNVLSIKIPPLREREGDIELLFKHFVNKICKRNGYIVRTIDPLIFNYLSKYSWPGNVRELQNVVERMMFTNNSEILSIQSLPEEIYGAVNDSTTKTVSPSNIVVTDGVSVEAVRTNKKLYFEGEERAMIRNMLLEYNGNITHIANMMKVSRNTIYRKLRKYGIEI